MLLVLPTRDLLREYHEYNDTFYFYDNGIKGIIKDILINDLEIDDVINLIISKYSNTVDARVQLINDLNNGFCYNTRESGMEDIIKNITNSVMFMMKGIFQNRHYNVSRYNVRWIESDLVIKIAINKKDEFIHERFIPIRKASSKIYSHRHR
jgi:hypothetical protein